MIFVASPTHPLSDEQRHQRRAQHAAEEAPGPASAAVAAHDHERPLRGEGAAQLRQRPATRRVDDQVPPPRPVGEVLAGVVDHVVRADRSDQVHLRGAAHAGDGRAGCLRDLHRERSHAAARADHQHATGPAAPSPRRGRPAGRSCPEIGIAAACSKVRSAGFGTSLSAGVTASSANEPARRCPSPRRPGRKPVTFAPTASTVPATSQPRTATFGRRNPSIGRAMYGIPAMMCHTSGPRAGRVHPDEDVVLAHHGLLDVAELQHVRRAVPILHDRLHRVLPLVGGASVCTPYTHDAERYVYGVHLSSRTREGERMSTEARGSRDRGARAPLTRERVLRTAVALADQGGVESLSMRKLAQELGVVPMALYKHVANKDELLDGMVDVVVGEIDPPLERRRLEDGDARADPLGPARASASSLGVARDGVAHQPDTGRARLHGLDDRDVPRPGASRST